MLTSGGRFDLDMLNERIAEHEAKMGDPDFWNDGQAAQQLIEETNGLKEKRDNFFCTYRTVLKICRLR